MRGGKPALAVDATADLQLLGDGAKGAEEDEVIRPARLRPSAMMPTVVRMEGKGKGKFWAS